MSPPASINSLWLYGAGTAQMIDLHGRPRAIRCDNGSELTSQAFTDWRKEQDIDLRFNQPGKPDQNAYIERFNRRTARKS